MNRRPAWGRIVHALALAACLAGTLLAPVLAADERPVIVFLGDSLTAGYGLPGSQAFPALIEDRLAQAGVPARVINAGVSGDTSAGGLRRADWVLRQEPDLVIVGLGGNDGLRGLPPEELEKNLEGIIRKSRAAGARVLLLGMRMSPSLGQDYVRAFDRVYPRLAERLDVTLVPFMLEGVAGAPALNLPDGIHPNAKGHAVIADHLYPDVLTLLKSAPRQSAADEKEAE